MNNYLLRISAFAALLAFLSSFLYGCGDASKSDEYGNYRPNNTNYEYEFAEGNAYDNQDEKTQDSPEAPSPNEEYSKIEEIGFLSPQSNPLSTFSADVDTASYANVRRLIEDSSAIPEGAVRVEEFINYFDYDYPDPENGELFSRYVEIADCPWNSSNKLMLVSIKAEEIETEELPPSNIVFLIDSSGSMNGYDKLPLVQTAFSMLAENLSADDRISIVTYASSSETLLRGESGKNKDTILQALYSISASGSTNGEGGIRTAYDIAEQYFIKGGNNRVIIATDGDMNVGASSEDDLVKLIESKRDSGIYLSVLGFGTGNIKDNKMEAIADHGNGNYSYIDSVDEAKRVLVNEMSGNLYTVAKDVKIQVEFNPSTVESYRLIGYDNRIMDAHDFIDDSKDAGEVGSGHTVTALYELSLKGVSASFDGIQLEFGDQHTTEPEPSEAPTRSELCKVSVAYKDIDSESDKSTYISDLYGMEKYSDTPSDSIRLAGAAAEFAMLLKDSEYKGNSSYDQLIAAIGSLNTDDEKISELYELSKTASTLYR